MGRTNTKKIKILFLASGKENAPAPRTRAFQYLPHLKKRNFKCKVISYNLKFYFQPIGNFGKYRKLIIRLYRKIITLCYQFFQMIRFIISVYFYDIVFIQRVLPPIYIQKIIGILNPKIIFDFDDAIFVHSNREHRLRLKYIIKISKYIIVENEYNKKFVTNYNPEVGIITGPIDTDRYFPKQKKSSEKVVMGWIGSSSTTKYLRIIKEPLKVLSHRYPRLVVELIGADNVVFEGSMIRIKKWSLDSEVSNLQNFDIGIMSLPDNCWTRGKGGYKLLQYCAIGIPCVASPVGINKEIIQEGVNGFLAKNEKEWIEKLSLLIESRVLREKMGARGRKIAVNKYSFYCAVPKLIKIFRFINKK